MTYEEITSRFDGSNGIFKCPAHNDRQASLSISRGKDGRTVFYCHAGCKTEDVLSAAGLTFADIQPEKEAPKRTKKKLVQVYKYPSAEKLRYEPKSFAWRHLDSNGQYIYNRKGIPPELYMRGNEADTIYIVEGEKDVETMAANGYYAACTPDGAKESGAKWHDEFNAAFIGKHVRIIADNDKTGKAYAEFEAKQLVKIALSIKVFDIANTWANCAEHSDVTDLYNTFGEGSITAAIDDLEQKTPYYNEHELPFDLFANFYTIDGLSEEERKPPEFIVDSLIPCGMTFLAGAPKIRKSFMALQIAAAVATGKDFLGFNTHQCDVVYFDLEGSKSRSYSRCKYMTTPMPNNVFITNRTAEKLADGKLLDLICELHKAKPTIRLFIIDTFSRARGSYKSGGANAYDADVALLEPVQQLAIDEKIAILLVHHEKKGAGMAQDSFERLSGTMGISGSADGVINLVADGKRFEGKAKLEYNPRDGKGGELSLVFDDMTREWKKDLFADGADLLGNPITRFCIDSAPEKNHAGEFFAYDEVYRAAYNTGAESAGDKVQSEIKDKRQQLYEEYGIGIQAGVKQNGKRGIRLFRVM